MSAVRLRWRCLARTSDDLCILLVSSSAQNHLIVIMTKFRTIFAIPEIVLLAYVLVDCRLHVAMFALLFVMKAVLVLHATKRSSSDVKETTKRRKYTVVTGRILCFVIRNVVNCLHVENMYVNQIIYRLSRKEDAFHNCSQIFTMMNANKS